LEKRGYKYLVKWRNCSETSWEARFALPSPVVKFYEEDIARLGSDAPDYLDQVDDDIESDSEEEDSETEDEESEGEGKIKEAYMHNIESNLSSQIGIKESEVEIQSDYFENKKIIKELENTTQTSFRSENLLENSCTTNNNEIDTTLESLKKGIFKSCDPKGSKRKREKVGLDKWITNSKKNTCLEEKSRNGTQLLLCDKMSNDHLNSTKEREIKIHDKNVSKEMESHCAVKESKKNKVIMEKKQKKNGRQVDQDKSKDAAKSRKVKKKQEPEEEDTYIIESLLEKKGSKFLVKWEQYSEEWNSWEPKSGLPIFITKYYEQDLSRLGSPAPGGPEELGDYSLI